MNADEAHDKVYDLVFADLLVNHKIENEYEQGKDRVALNVRSSIGHEIIYKTNYKRNGTGVVKIKTVIENTIKSKLNGRLHTE